MTLRNKTSYFNNEDSLIEYIYNREKIDIDSTVGIVAGHFMLGFEPSKNELVPLIKEEKNSLQEFSALVTKGFPVKSFKIGLRLSLLFIGVKIKTKIILLVNDHRFQDSNFQIGIEDQIKDKGGELRKSFYRHVNAIPLTYQKALSKNKMEVNDVFLDNNNEGENENRTLPSETYLFSEHILQKRFRRHTIKRYVNEGAFYETGPEQKKDVLYKADNQSASYCIVGYGRIGCIGIAIELLIEIVKRNISDIILIIPNECTVQSNQAAEVVLQLLKQKLRVTIISNIENKNEKIIVSEHE